MFRAAAILLASATVSAGQQSGVRTPTTTSARSIVRPTAVRPLAGARTAGLATIQGNALDSSNAQMTNATVRLRDARFGQIIDTELTDTSGMFTFKSVDPGSYIVEVMGNDSSVLAASQILSVEGGIISAVVKLPFRMQTFGAILGTNSTTTATTIVTQAATSGIVAVVATDPVSPIE